ncbi:MAG: type II toxin-antitoxin system TacA family antitoxin [Gammaproteobacteria bacterium]
MAGEECGTPLAGNYVNAFDTRHRFRPATVHGLGERLDPEPYWRHRQVHTGRTHARDDQRPHQHAVLEGERIIRLSRRGSEVFFKALEKPPAPNARLKKVVAAYKRSPLHAED